VTVQVWNESDRVNLNTASVPLLRALLIQVGARPAQAEQLAGAIYDWRTTGPASQDGGPKAPRYQAAGLPYTPPNTPFVSVQDLADVLGMTPDVFNRLTDHVTVLTEADPDSSTHDPVVVQALAQVADTAGPAAPAPQPAGDVLRVVATAVGSAGARYTVMEVASGDFQTAAPRVRILSRARLP
jgi:general secretion pathway protein K